MLIAYTTDSVFQTLP